jgi:hypothetical protein
VAKTPNSADIQLLHEVAAAKDHIEAMQDLLDRLRRPVYGGEPPRFSRTDENLLREIRDRLMGSIPSREAKEKLSAEAKWDADYRARVAAACERVADVIGEQ